MTTPLELSRNEEKEAWWREQYYGIHEHKYKLRPRYHPKFDSSWMDMGDGSLTVEDVQPSIVSSPPLRTIDANR